MFSSFSPRSCLRTFTTFANNSLPDSYCSLLYRLYTIYVRCCAPAFVCTVHIPHTSTWCPHADCTAKQWNMERLYRYQHWMRTSAAAASGPGRQSSRMRISFVRSDAGVEEKEKRESTLPSIKKLIQMQTPASLHKSEEPTAQIALIASCTQINPIQYPFMSWHEMPVVLHKYFLTNFLNTVYLCIP